MANNVAMVPPSQKGGDVRTPNGTGAPGGWWCRLLPVALYSLLTAIIFFPASLAPGSYLMEGPFFFGELFNIFLVDEHLRADRTLVFATQMLNYPDGGYLVFIAWSNIALSLILKTVISLLAAYNISVMIMLVLGGLGGFWLIRHITRDYWASLVGGIIFGFNPYIISIVANAQIGYSNHVWIPLYILLLIKFYAHLRVRHLLLLAACAVAALLNSPYYAVFCWMFTALYPLFLLLGSRAQWKRVLLATVLVFGVVAVAQIPPYGYLSKMEQDERYQLLPTPKCQLQRFAEVIRLDSQSGPSRSISQNSADVLSFFLPKDQAPEAAEVGTLWKTRYYPGMKTTTCETERPGEMFGHGASLPWIIALGLSALLLCCSDDSAPGGADSAPVSVDSAVTDQAAVPADTGKSLDMAGKDGPKKGDIASPDKGTTDSTKGTNLASQAKVSVSFNEPLKAYLIDGIHEGDKPKCESYYYWFSKFPMGQDKQIVLTWAQAVTVGRVVVDTFPSAGAVHANCNKSDQGRTMAGATIQYDKGGAWTTLKTVSGKTDDWSVSFSPVGTTKLRLLTPGSIKLTTNPVVFEVQVFAK